MRIPALIEDELRHCGLPWHIEQGKRHKIIRVKDQMVGILPNAKAKDSDTRAILNVRAQIRRAVKGLST